MNSKAKIAIFDFDGTITSKDTFIDFLRFAKGNTKFFVGIILLSPVILAYYLNLLNNESLKRIFIKYYLGNLTKQEYFDIAENYAENRLPGLIKIEAIKKIYWHKWRKHDVVIVSASVKDWIINWTDSHGIRLIANELEFDNNSITGNLSDRNCDGMEKVKKLTKEFNLTAYKYIFAYGNSKGDKEILELADEKFYRCFKY